MKAKQSYRLVLHSKDKISGHTAHIDCLKTGIINIVFTDLSGNPVNINNWAMSIVLWQVDE